MAQLAALLRTDLSRMAEEVRRAGRGKDTILAHITPREAALLKARGGSGELNPNTGLPEFQTDDEMYGFGYEGAPYTEQVQPSPVIQSQDLYQPSGYPSEGEFGLGQPIGGQGMPLTEPAYGLGMYGAETMPSAATPQIDLTRAGGIGSQGFGATEPIELGIAGGMAGAPSVSPPQEKSVLDRIQAGLKTPLGYGALGAIPAILQSRRAAGQARGLQAELGKLGQEARTTGQQLVQQARAGQLPAAQQQALEAQRLAAMQNLQRRGVTDATAMQQVENQLQAQKAAFIDQTLNQGMKLINVADQYTAQAIRAGYQADAQAQQLLGNFFQNYMRVLGGQTTQPGKP
jgi:hypothetical protein